MPDLQTQTPKEKITQFIQAITPEQVKAYSDYWQTITPDTHEECYNRWRFAFLSVHTTWKTNVKAYVELKGNATPTTKEILLQQIRVSGVGLNKMRTEGLWKFKQDFWADPESWYRQKDESWVDCRERLMNRCHGIGYAKTSFALELCYPVDCGVTCLDTHALQMYGVKSSPVPSPTKYKELEKHWMSVCQENKVPAFMVRNIYWDRIQEQKSSQYWSYVFEKPKDDVQAQPTQPVA
jgi:thermostable 8-oxoguanine DNA glycosylase